MDAHDQHEVVRRVDQECHESLVVRPEMQCAQRHGRVAGLVAAALILKRVDDHHGVHKRSQCNARRRAQGSEFLLRGAVQFPQIRRSDAVPGADLCRVMRCPAGGGPWVR